MSKLTPARVSLLQASGLVIYVFLFAFGVKLANEWGFPEPSPPLGIALFLLVFMSSALICSSIALGYPIFLFFSDRRSEALKIVFGTLGWLVAFLAVLLLWLVGRS